ncbi:MAG TPA: hypothetical protein VFE46_14185 [Pirellulales bacterium]|nr:hypothetical protein [Pirellulales bacterium]
MISGTRFDNRDAMNRKQLQQQIAEQLSKTPERSNRWIAKMLGVDHKTVARVRAKVQATGDFPQLLSADGKYRPRRRPRKVQWWIPVPHLRIENSKTLSSLLMSLCRSCHDQLQLN